MPVLIVEHNGSRRGALLPQRVLIGRQSMNQLVIDHRAVSRMHAWLDGDGVSHRITDCNSRTGTRVNGLPIYPGKPLEDGDRIEVGPARLIYYIDAELPDDVEPFVIPEPGATPDDGKGVRFDCRKCAAPLWAPITHVGEPVGCSYCQKSQRVPPPTTLAQAGVPTGLSVRALVVAGATSTQIDVAPAATSDVVVARPVNPQSSASRRIVRRGATRPRPAVRRIDAGALPLSDLAHALNGAHTNGHNGHSSSAAATIDDSGTGSYTDSLRPVFPSEGDLRSQIVADVDLPPMASAEPEIGDATADVSATDEVAGDQYTEVSEPTPLDLPEAQSFEYPIHDSVSTAEAFDDHGATTDLAAHATAGGDYETSTGDASVAVALADPIVEADHTVSAIPSSFESTASPIEVPAHDARQHVEKAICGVCQSDIEAGEARAKCPKCGLDFHAECWAENYGCSAYGCSMVNALAPPEELAQTETSGEQVEAAGMIAADDGEILDAPKPVPWDYVLLAAGVVSLLLGAISFGAPSLVAAVVSLVFMSRDSERRRNPVLLIAVGLSVVGIATGVAVSYLLYLGGRRFG